MKRFFPVKHWKSVIIPLTLSAIGGITVVGVAQNATPPANTAAPTFGAPAAATGAPAADRPCVLPAQGLVTWLPGEDSAADIFASKTTAPATLTYAPGKVGQAFNLRGNDFKIAASPRLDLGTGAGFTWEAWINPTDVMPRHPIFDFNNGETYGVHFWIFSLQNAPGTLFANFQDTTGAAHIITTQPDAIKANEWQHVAMTYDKRTGVGAIYVNGFPAGQATIGQFRPQTTYDMVIGHRPAGAGSGMRFNGQIDEISLYNRALTGNEIRAIFQAGASGKCNPQKVAAAAPPPATAAVKDKEPAAPPPVPTPTPLPKPTPTLIPAPKVNQPLAAFTFASAEGVDASLSQRVVDALTDELRKAGVQIKPRQESDKVFATLAAEYEKQHSSTGANATTPGATTPGATTTEVLAPDVRDTTLRRRAAQQQDAKAIFWGEVQQVAVAKGQPPRLKFVVRLMDAASGAAVPEVVVSESLAESAAALSPEDATAELIRKAVSAATARIIPLITQ